MASSGSNNGATSAIVRCTVNGTDPIGHENSPLLHKESPKNILNYSTIDFVRPVCDPENGLNDINPESSTAGSSSSSGFAVEGDDDGHCPQVELADSAPSSFWSSFDGLVPEGISLTLHNSGSVARDHLASERTFLAYMRTSLAIASSGVALVQLFTAAGASSKLSLGEHRLHTFVLPLGATTVGLGLVILFIGTVRYYSIQAALTKGLYPAARVTTGFVAVALTCLVTVTFAILLSGKLEPK